MSTDEASKRDPNTVEIAVVGNANAPFIYFDGVGALGIWGGAIQLELAANTTVPIADGTKKETIVTAHLRTTIAGLAALKDAVQKLEAMLAPENGKPN